jgi:hypothetical protein
MHCRNTSMESLRRQQVGGDDFGIGRIAVSVVSGRN